MMMMMITSAHPKASTSGHHQREWITLDLIYSSSILLSDEPYRFLTSSYSINWGPTILTNKIHDPSPLSKIAYLVWCVFGRCLVNILAGHLTILTEDVRNSPQSLQANDSIVLWHTDPLIGNYHETNNGTTAVAMQQILSKQQLNYNKEETCFLHSPCQDVISRESESCRASNSVKTRLEGWCETATSLGSSSVEAMSELWEIRQTVMTWAEGIVKIHYQETTSEDFMCAAVTVIFRVCKPVRLLQLLVVPSCV
jgi:hypothetical protein